MERMIDAIPFGKPVRVGNFKLWMSNYLLSTAPTEAELRKYSAEYNGKKKVKPKKTVVRCINASTLDGAFSVRIPQTFEMFPMLSCAYQWMLGEDVGKRERGEDYIRTVLSNIFYVSSICNGYYHRGIEMVSAAYANPDVLRDKERKEVFSADVDRVINGFLSWLDEYKNTVKEYEPTNEEYNQENIAEQAVSVLNQNDNENE